MKKIICFGDSLTWGYIPAKGGRYSEEVRWTALLQKQLGCTVIEEGLNGRTSIFRDPLLPFGTGADYIQACVLSHSPADLLIIMLGINDMKTYICNCLDASTSGIITLASMVREVAPDMKILIVSPPPIGRHITELDPELGMMAQLNEESIQNSWELGRLLKVKAEIAGIPFMDAAEYVSASAADAVHLDEEGHRKLAQAIAAKISEIIGR